MKRYNNFLFLVSLLGICLWKPIGFLGAQTVTSPSLGAQSSFGRPDDDSLTYFKDSIAYGSYREMPGVIERAISYSERQKDTLSLYSFKLEQCQLLFMSGQYMAAYDSLIILEKMVSTYMDRPSLMQDTEQMPFCVRSFSDSLWMNLHVDVARILVQTDVYLRDFSEAMDLVVTIRTVYSRDSMDLVAGYCDNAIGVILARNSNLEKAKEYYLRASEIFRNHDNGEMEGSVYINMTYTYLVLGEQDSALQYALKAYALLHQDNVNKERYINSELCLAWTYRSLKQYALAEAYLLKALEDADAWHCEHLSAYVRNNLVELYSETKQYDKAEYYARQNLALITTNPSVREFCYHRLALIQERKGDYMAGFSFLDSAYFLSKEVVSDNENLHLTYLQRRFDSYRKESEKRHYEQTLLLTKTQLRNSLLITGIILLLGIGLTVLVVVLGRRLYVSYRLNRLISKRLDESETENQKSKDDMQFHIRKVLDDKQKALSEKDKELTAMALYITKVDGLTEALGEKLRAMRVMGHPSAKEKMYISEMESLLKSVAPDKNWNEFELYFKQVDKEFFDKLEAKYPDLTPNEKRLCALVRLNLNAKEIASITSRTYRSVNMAKMRLKKKFGCDKDQRLYDFLMQL